MPDDDEIAVLRSIDEPYRWDAAPGYRTRALSDDEAWDAMAAGADRLVREALSVRRSLLALGFAVDHKLCRELDDTARRYDEVFGAVRRQRRAPVSNVDA